MSHAPWEVSHDKRNACTKRWSMGWHGRRDGIEFRVFWWQTKSLGESCRFGSMPLFGRNCSEESHIQRMGFFCKCCPRWCLRLWMRGNASGRYIYSSIFDFLWGTKLSLPSLIIRAPYVRFEGTVDVVTFSYALSMIPDWRLAIRNAFRMLKVVSDIISLSEWLHLYQPQISQNEEDWCSYQPAFSRPYYRYHCYFLCYYYPYFFHYRKNFMTSILRTRLHRVVTLLFVISLWQRHSGAVWAIYGNGYLLMIMSISEQNISQLWR